MHKIVMAITSSIQYKIQIQIWERERPRERARQSDVQWKNNNEEECRDTVFQHHKQEKNCTRKNKRASLGVLRGRVSEERRLARFSRLSDYKSHFVVLSVQYMYNVESP